MQLVTGFLKGALKGRKCRPRARSPLLELSFPIRTLHLLPGRVRFGVPKLKGNHAAADSLAAALARLDGVKEVRVTAHIGTVLVRFDADTLQPELLVAAIVRLLGLEREMEQAPPSAAARRLQAAGRAVDRACYDQTFGLIDLSTALPLTLGALGVYRLLNRQGPMLPPGATLLWWALSSMRRGYPNPRAEER